MRGILVLCNSKSIFCSNIGKKIFKKEICYIILSIESKVFFGKACILEVDSFLKVLVIKSEIPSNHLQSWTIYRKWGQCQTNINKYLYCFEKIDIYIYIKAFICRFYSKQIKINLQNKILMIMCCTKLCNKFYGGLSNPSSKCISNLTVNEPATELRISWELQLVAMIHRHDLI